MKPKETFDPFPNEVSDFGYSQNTHNVVCPCCERIFLTDTPGELCSYCEAIRLDRVQSLKLLAWIITITFVLAAVSCRGASVVTDAMLDRVAWAESRNNPHAVGRAGERGAYQLKSIAVREVNRVYRANYTPADRVARGREIAALYLAICERRTKQPKTESRIYATYRGKKN